MPRKSYDVDAMARRIVAAFDASSAADLAAGLDWYSRAERESIALAAGTSLSPASCAAVIAALSPRNAWVSNLRGAADMVTAATFGGPEPLVAGTTANRAKAWAIALGADPADTLGGPKVTAFWANISGDVDAGAARAAEGADWTERAPSGRRYEAIADAYRLAAQWRNVAPRDMQAAVWVHIRGAAE